ncbi:stage V sporulation protein AE [Clostridium tetani]|uniref:Stage V sporulation protein AE n=2 Tax=Clostridium tetani TaxID=1513 RepID=A0ABY0EPM4_CLOTA|nr:stage V sporulation protein AE [Clostridium tetani]RXI56375.1 stage V sporulation protein AE [Clostridium tetani]RXI71201.1 stage V sporulation protein AE [Clostridium tetani]CDI50427.1 stage V sporulation protein AE [Clostridium tetani 12124569]
MMNDYIMAFLVGGAICVVAQIIINKSKFTPARILVTFVTVGVILGALNIYDVVVKVGKAGATVPLPGFGFNLAKSTIKEVDQKGFIGIFTGGVTGSAGGITAAIVFGYLMAVIFNSKTKE